jgi:predicted nuclease of predicted toxin-antitoxin system
VPLALYMDAHVPGQITRGLRRVAVDVLTAQEDAADAWPDDALLDRATSLGRVLVTFDDDLLAEAARRQQEGIPFAGVIFAQQLDVSYGQCIQDLELIAKAGTTEDVTNRVLYLPL